MQKLFKLAVPQRSYLSFGDNDKDTAGSSANWSQAHIGVESMAIAVISILSTYDEILGAKCPALLIFLHHTATSSMLATRW